MQQLERSPPDLRPDPDIWGREACYAVLVVASCITTAAASFLVGAFINWPAFTNAVVTLANWAHRRGEWPWLAAGCLSGFVCGLLVASLSAQRFLFRLGIVGALVGIAAFRACNPHDGPAGARGFLLRYVGVATTAAMLVLLMRFLNRPAYPTRQEPRLPARLPPVHSA
jgi:hypothetical protein